MPVETKSPTNLLEFVQFEMLPYALVVIIVAYVAGRIASRSLDALGEQINARRLLFKQVSAVTRFAILIVATALVTSSLFSFSQEALFAVGGSAAVAIGFAFKDLLASLMAGIILLFDRPFSVGDRISFNKIQAARTIICKTTITLEFTVLIKLNLFIGTISIRTNVIESRTITTKERRSQIIDSSNTLVFVQSNKCRSDGSACALCHSLSEIKIVRRSTNSSSSKRKGRARNAKG